MALNGGWTYASRIAPAAAGRTLLDHLCRSYVHSDAGTWRARLDRGEIALDGHRATGSEPLRPGQQLTWSRPPWDEPDVPLTFTIVHEDAALLVVSKPAGLPTMPAGGFLEHTLWALIRLRYPDASPLHRLGRFTSGLVVCARTPEAGAIMSRAWREHRVTKEYRALGVGRPDWTSREITTPIGPVPHPTLGSVHAAAGDGKPARSVARVVAARGENTLFEVAITTGRPHQIRIHLASAGHPLVGDPLYAVGGVPRADSPGLPGDGGYWLHAHRVELEHPITGELLRLETGPPQELAGIGN
jgi:23S rRNA pseudouridine1911/1915/1917 synthase